MSEPQSQPEEEPAKNTAPPTLSYGRPDPRPSPANDRPAVFGRMALGCAGYLILSFVWFGIAPSLLSSPSAAHSAIKLWGCATVALLALTLWIRITYGYKGFGYGVLMALLLGFLIIGGFIALIAFTCAHWRYG